MSIFAVRQQWPLVLLVMIPFVALDGFLLVTDNRWVGELGWTVDWANGGLYLASSLLAALAAFAATPYLRSGPLLASASRVGPTRMIASLWVWLTALALAGHAVVVATALVVTWSTSPTDSVLPLAFGYSVLSTPLATAAGIALAALMRSILSAPVALIVAYFASYATALGTLQIPVLVGGQFTSMAGLQYVPDTLEQYALRTGAFVLVLLIVAVAALSPRRPAWVRAVTVVASIAVIAAATLLSPPADRIGVAETPAPLVCTGTDLTVCVAAGHTRHLDQVADDVGRALDVLRRAGADVVGRLDEPRPQSPVHADAGVLDLPSSDLNALRFGPADYARAVVVPRDCDAYYALSATTNDLFGVQEALAGWVLFRLDESQVPDDRVSRGVVELPDSWAAAAYDDLRACQVTPATSDAIPK